MTNLKDVVTDRLEAGERVDLDEFGVEYVIKVAESCRACDSHYKQTHGGWGSICYECKEPWREPMKHYLTHYEPNLGFLLSFEDEPTKEEIAEAFLDAAATWIAETHPDDIAGNLTTIASAVVNSSRRQ